MQCSNSRVAIVARPAAPQTIAGSFSLGSFLVESRFLLCVWRNGCWTRHAWTKCKINRSMDRRAASCTRGELLDVDAVSHWPVRSRHRRYAHGDSGSRSLQWTGYHESARISKDLGLCEILDRSRWRALATDHRDVLIFTSDRESHSSFFLPAGSVCSFARSSDAKGPRGKPHPILPQG